MESYKQHFSRFLASKPERLHFAAHSHHLWPDCSFDAHCQAWLDAAEYIDGKWGPIFAEVVPQAQAHIARHLSLPDPETICFAPNTHEFVLRLHSCLPQPATILTTDAEFHSFHRQHQRWQEAGLAQVQIVAAEPFDDLAERFLERAREGRHSMVYLSQVFFNSGYVVEFLEELVDVLRDRDTLLVIDGYHGFMAVPTSLEALADRAFFIAGGYKYAMSGEGVCFMHCPPKIAPRPVNTGWFSGFDGLESGVARVGYPDSGMRFSGATFDVSGLYRFNAVQRLLLELGLGVGDIHQRVQRLQSRFLAGIAARGIELGTLVPGEDARTRGHFLTFRTERAASIHEELRRRDVLVDFRGDRLRFGFAIYHDPADVDELLQRLVR